MSAPKPSVRERNPLTAPKARAFQLVRDEDETGISGSGVVAEGVEFSNGFCAMSWLTAQHSVAVYPNIKALEAIHGHNGRTRVVWDDVGQFIVPEGIMQATIGDMCSTFLMSTPIDVPPDRTEAIEAAISLEYDDCQWEIARQEFLALTGRLPRYLQRAAQVNPNVKAAGERRAAEAGGA